MNTNIIDVDLTDVLPLLQGEIHPENCPRKTLEFAGSYLGQEKVTSDDLNYLRQSTRFHALMDAVQVDMPYHLRSAPLGLLMPILQGRFDEQSANFWHEQDVNGDYKYSGELTVLTSNDGVSMKSLDVYGPVALRALVLHNPVLHVQRLETPTAN